MKVAYFECISRLQYIIIGKIVDINQSAKRNRVIALEILYCEKKALYLNTNVEYKSTIRNRREQWKRLSSQMTFTFNI